MFKRSSALVSNMFQSMQTDDAVFACMCVDFTLHPCGSKLLTSEKDGVIMVFFIVRVLPLLFECPATHILQTLRRISQLNEACGLKAYMRRTLYSKLHFDFRN